MDRANHGVKDASLIKTKTLPAAESTNTATDGIDLGVLSARGARLEDCELLISAPALGATPLPDTKTMTYSVESDDNSAFSSAKIVADKLIVQTGADAAGADAAAARFKIPSDCERYLRVKATAGAGTADASGSSVTASLLF